MYPYESNGQLTMLDMEAFEEMEYSPKQKAVKPDSALIAIPYFHLDLSPDHVDLFGCHYWELRSPWREGKPPLNTGVAPREPIRVSLSEILEQNPDPKYYLSQTACRGILRRSEERNKEFPPQLKKALMIQSGLTIEENLSGETDPIAFAANQRDEVRDLHDVAGALAAQPGMKQQTFLVSASAENTSPDVLCLNDQGGQVMECSENICGTLRAQEHGHQPLVYENHGIDARYTGPHAVAPTISARFGTGGNNCSLVEQEPVYCIVGNVIDRQPKNGGNGKGYQKDLAYTLTAMDRHAVWKEPYQKVVGALCRGDEKGVGNQYISQDKCIVHKNLLIRRLTPLECERLQGFPDDWTNLPKASDSARYKALGNSVAIPCVEFLMCGLALALRDA
ncbi:MAG: DNA cytosine methyltransferase [Oscillospiraceae bacterium]|nr:DNA cytosine methyltransferase [Oscillospiraceae bacterium]